MADQLTLDVTKDGWTGGIQLSINCVSDNGWGHGYRIAGPKFNGSGSVLLSAKLTERDAGEIRAYLDRVFPTEAALGREEE